MVKKLRRVDSFLESAYRSPEAADEYFARHRKSRIRRFVSRREARIVIELLREGFGKVAVFDRQVAAQRTDTAVQGLTAPILDVPSGAGRLTARLQDAGFDPIACDSSIDMILRGVAAGAIDSDRCLAGSVFALPFGRNAFAGGVCVRFMHHLERASQRREVLSEMRRVVNGPVVASVWSGTSFPRFRRAVKRALGRRRSSRFCIPLPELREDARRAGWRVDKVRYLFPFLAETAYLLLI